MKPKNMSIVSQQTQSATVRVLSQTEKDEFYKVNGYYDLQTLKLAADTTREELRRGKICQIYLYRRNCIGFFFFITGRQQYF